MSVDSFRVYRTVQHIVRDLANSRLEEEEPVEYPTPREAMLQLHGDWQDLVTAVRVHEIPDHAAAAAMRLAASAIKFAMDLGEPSMIAKLEELPWNGVQPQSGLTPSQKRKKKKVR